MRIAIAGLLIVHGLIHLLGFVKAFGLARVPQLSGATLLALPESWAKPIGVAWLLACVLCLAAAVSVLARASAAFVVLGAASVLLSQALVIYAWPDAKAGTIANVLVALALLVAWADLRFQRENDAAVDALLAGLPTAPAAVVTREELAPLPAPVQRWLERSGTVGTPRLRSVRLRQRGQMRIAPDSAAMPAEAEQYFRVEPPGFVWRVRVRMAHVLPIAGRDSYLDGKGHMLIKAASLLPVVDAADAKIDQGTLLRFLGEMVWLPSAALSDYLRWEPIDANSARVTMSHRGVSADAVFAFDELGRVVEVRAQRYLGSGNEAKLERWHVPCRQWDVLDGIEVPVRGDVVWKLASGDFNYYPWAITALERDRPTRW